MKSFIQRLRGHFHRNRRGYLLTIVFMLLMEVAEIVLPRLVGLLTDKMLNGSLRQKEFTSLALLLVVSILLSYLFNAKWSIELFYAAMDLTRRMRPKMAGIFLRRKPAFFQRHSVADIVSSSIHDVYALESFAGYGVLCYIDGLITPLSILIMMLFTVPVYLILFGLLPLLIMVPSLYLFSRKIEVAFERLEKSYDEIYNDVLEKVTGIRMFRSYALEDFAAFRFRETVNQNEESYLEYRKLILYWIITSNIARGVTLLIALGMGGWFVHQGRISLGTLLSFTLYLQLMISPMQLLADGFSEYKSATAAIKRISKLTDEVFEEDEDVTSDDEEKKEASPPREALRAFHFQFNHLDFYHEGKTVPSLSQISFELEDGQTLALVGRTGSGKTTLLQQFFRYYPLPDGKVTVNGKEMNDYSSAEFHAHIAYVPQEAKLFSQSIRDNLLFGREGLEENDLREALQAASFYRELESLPQGMETIIGERGVMLSGGQKQRLSLARALLGEPKLLLLDDCLSAVDAQTEQKILTALKSRNQNCTTVLTAHRLSAVHDADLILVLEEGKIIERGNHEELMKREGWYASQYRLQSMQKEGEGQE